MTHLKKNCFLIVQYILTTFLVCRCRALFPFCVKNLWQYLVVLPTEVFTLEFTPIVQTQRKKGSVEQHEEICNLNIHKALCLFLSRLCLREIFLFRCGFWQLPLTVTSMCPKYHPLLLRGTSNLSIIAGLEANASTFGYPLKLTSFHNCIEAHLYIVYRRLILMPRLCSQKEKKKKTLIV